MPCVRVTALHTYKPCPFHNTNSQACGVLYTITPFVSFRHAAAVTAAVSAGGYVGAVVLQAACFLAVA